MDICKTEQEYLGQIIEPARRCCKRYGYLPSVLIAQSCLENGYGIPSYWDNPQVRALVGVNNMVGIKRELLNKSWVDAGLSVWAGGYIRKDTPEQYGGQVVTIKDDFRTYDCIERSFADYLCFMTWASNYGAGGEPKYGQKVLSITDPETLIKTVSRLGYATGQTYPASVMRIVKKHNLAQYDSLDGVSPTDYYPGKGGSIRIIPNTAFEPTHNTSKRTGAIEYIYIHYVGALGGAAANVAYYNQPSTRDASADFYVDFDGTAYQYNMDIQNRYCWAVGGGRQTGYGGSFLGRARNANGISIEMCVRNTTGRAQAANSPTWYFEQATVDGAVKLAKYLMGQYRIPAGNVIRHFDVNGKLCPGVTGWNDATGSNEAWNAFKARLDGETPSPQVKTMYRVQVGAYKDKGRASDKQGATEKRSGYKCFMEQGADGLTHVYCGSFGVKANAEERARILDALGIPTTIKEAAAHES